MRTSRDIIDLRHHGLMGGYIVPHRAFRRIRLSPAEIFCGLLLLLGGTAGWVALLPRLAISWVRILSFWIQRLWPGTAVLLVDRSVVANWRILVPYIAINAGPITGRTWFVIAAGSSLLFAISFKIPKDTQLPMLYLVRAISLIQWTALAYTGFLRHFPHDPSEYCTDMLLFGMIFSGFVPTVLGLTFYVFDVSIAKKVALTVLTMAHLALFIPLQYLLHACILRVSLLFLPVLYLAFGPFLDVVVFIAFYSWGMSWSPKLRRS